MFSFYCHAIIIYTYNMCLVVSSVYRIAIFHLLTGMFSTLCTLYPIAFDFICLCFHTGQFPCVLETLVLFLSQFSSFLRFEPIPVEFIGMSLMLCIFDPIVLDFGCLRLYGGVVFTCAVFLYYFLLCSLFSLFDLSSF